MIRIKKASVQDAALIAAIGKQTFLESHAHSAAAEDIAEYVEAKYSLTVVEADLSDPASVFYIIYIKAQAAGYSKVIFDTPNPNVAAENITKLERLYILKAFYDLKLGWQLFEWNRGLSKQQNQAGIWLFVWTENHRALAFYKKMGFVVVGNRDFKITERHYNPNFEMYLAYE